MHKASFKAFTALLICVLFASGCSNGVTPNSGLALAADPVGTPKVGTTLIFSFVSQYFSQDTSTSTQTVEITADSVHRPYDIFNNVTWWHIPVNGQRDFLLNYTNQSVQLQTSQFIWTANNLTYSTFDLTPTPTDFHEIYKLDSIYTDSMSSSLKIRDSLRTIGVETLKLAGLSIPTIHMQELARYWHHLSNNSIYTYQLVTDYWYAPSMGFFVMEDRANPINVSRNHLELIAYYAP